MTLRRAQERTWSQFVDVLMPLSSSSEINAASASSFVSYVTLQEKQGTAKHTHIHTHKKERRVRDGLVLLWEEGNRCCFVLFRLLLLFVFLGALLCRRRRVHLLQPPAVWGRTKGSSACVCVCVEMKSKQTRMQTHTHTRICAHMRRRADTFAPKAWLFCWCKPLALSMRSRLSACCDSTTCHRASCTPAKHWRPLLRNSGEQKPAAKPVVGNQTKRSFFAHS